MSVASLEFDSVETGRFGMFGRRAEVIDDGRNFICQELAMWRGKSEPVCSRNDDGLVGPKGGIDRGSNDICSIGVRAASDASGVRQLSEEIAALVVDGVRDPF